MDLTTLLVDLAGLCQRVTRELVDINDLVLSTDGNLMKKDVRD